MSIVGIFGQWRQWGLWLVWLLPAHAALAADLNLPRDGWATWQVATVADAPDWCCFDRDGDRPSRNCELDGRNHGYGSRSEDAPVASMQIYARFKGGSPDRIRAYGPNCPVSAKTAIADLGEVDADRSAQWLAAQITPRSDRSGDALAALAAHAGTTAQTELVRVAKANPARAVAFQGAPGCNGHRAALEYAPGCLPLPCFSFEDAIEAVREGRADRAIIPIEMISAAPTTIGGLLWRFAS